MLDVLDLIDLYGDPCAVLPGETKFNWDRGIAWLAFEFANDIDWNIFRTHNLPPTLLLRWCTKDPVRDSLQPEGSHK